MAKEASLWNNFSGHIKRQSAFNLFGHLTVIENIMLAPMKLLGVGKQEAYDEGIRLLRKVGLADRVGDIIRSQTYEAFFPLIAVAVIYFLLAGILIFIVGRIQLKVDPKRRKREKILQGVKTDMVE